MAALRLFTRTKLSTIILRCSSEHESLKGPLPILAQVSKRWGSFVSSPRYEDPSAYTDYATTEDPKEWEYVERLLKHKIIPAPCLDRKEYPSGWKPATVKPQDNPYYIGRTKNYMQPVYLKIFNRGMQRVTCLRRIHGDIWKLEEELKRYLEEAVNKPVGIRTHELAGVIKFRGDYVNLIKKWMDEKGF